MKQGLCFIKSIELDRPSSNDKRADYERLKESLQTDELSLSLDLLKTLPGVLREKDFFLKPVLFHMDGRHILLELFSEQCLGVAIDIGTTNLVASLYDFVTAEKLSVFTIQNPQLSFGVDILSRIHYAMVHNVEELQRALIEGINKLIISVCKDAGVVPENIYAASVCANTVMTHFLLGLEVRYIPVEPYIPVVHCPEIIRAREIDIHINREGLIYIFPNAGSYVGGDIIAGIIATELHRRESTSILIDVGTNAEVVIGNRDWILVGAGAAGPALEGGIISSGMMAEDGAIYRIDIDDRDRSIKYKTIKDTPPRGICGSGVIDLVAELYRTGIIDNRGRIKERTDYIKEKEGHLFIEIADSIGITEREIENFLRSKAAMFTSIYVLVRSIGLSFSDIERIYIAGALGSGVRVEKAQTLGMLPLIDKDRFISVGNSALKGAEMFLMDASLIAEIRDVQSRITYHEMNTDRDFMMLFPSALFIPHAEPEMLS
ncbi:MAG: ATP-binding protein [Nitrospirae bacterium]|nr:ATP-binding protein [Nitrospirota bacterium]